MSEWRIQELPKYVGSYEIVPGTYWNCTRKPHYFHRLMVRWLLGWKWTDHLSWKRTP